MGSAYRRWRFGRFAPACLLVLGGLSGAAGGPALAQGVTDVVAHRVGGGEGYGCWVEHADFRVRTRRGLLRALARATAPDVVYVEDDAVIDLTGIWRVVIPPGVTLASGRGRNGSLGALLRTSTEENNWLFEVGGPGVRITGLRLQGPTTVIDGPDCGGTDAIGISVRSEEPIAWPVEIDNNELWAWPHAAVSSIRNTGTHVHHNHIHHNRRRERTRDCRHYALGYGVVTSYGDVLIEANLFNHNRHDIASTGLPGSRYEARHNLVIEGLISHSFDMHGCPDREDHPECQEHPTRAGTLVDIHHNTFLQDSEWAVVIRGRPAIGAWITRNQFRHTPGHAALQRHDSGSFHLLDNEYSVDRLPGWFVSFGATGYWTFRAFSGVGMDDLRFGDFDGDGTADAFRANGSHWFVSRSTRLAWQAWNRSGFEVEDLRFGDLDGDGTTDVFRSNGSHWFVSWAGRTAWDRINTSAIEPWRLRLGDFDGDGTDDVFYSSGARWSVSWSGTSPWEQINTSALEPASLRFGDFDGDGTTDVFRTNGSNWFASWAGKSSWEQINTSAVGLDQLAFCDFDGDGSTDVFYANGERWRVSWGGRSPWQELNVSSFPVDALALADVNGDGRCDALAHRHP